MCPFGYTEAPALPYLVYSHRFAAKARTRIAGHVRASKEIGGSCQDPARALQTMCLGWPLDPGEAALPNDVDNSNEFEVVLEQAWQILNSRAEIAAAHSAAAHSEHASENREDVATVKNSEATNSSSAALDQQRRS